MSWRCFTWLRVGAERCGLIWIGRFVAEGGSSVCIIRRIFKPTSCFIHLTSLTIQRGLYQGIRGLVSCAVLSRTQPLHGPDKRTSVTSSLPSMENCFSFNFPPTSTFRSGLRSDAGTRLIKGSPTSRVSSRWKCKHILSCYPLGSSR